MAIISEIRNSSEVIVKRKARTSPILRATKKFGRSLIGYAIPIARYKD